MRLLKLFISRWKEQPKTFDFGFSIVIHLCRNASPLQGKKRRYFTVIHLISFIRNRFSIDQKSQLILAWIIAIIGLVPTLKAQQFPITNGTQQTCGGQFLDDTGTTGSYSNNNYTYTLCSSTPGQSISLLFQGMSLGVDAGNPANSDYLSIYDGNSTSAPLIGTFTGNDLQGDLIQASFQNSSGCLTFQFQNGSAPNGAGWEAQISCYTPCNQPTAVVTTPNLQSAPAGYGMMGCEGQAILFSAQSSNVPPGNTLINYIWNFGDGSAPVNTSSPTIEHTYTSFGQYLVHLTVITNTGCSSTNATQFQVMVSTRPLFLDLDDIDPGPHLTCANPSLLTFDAGDVQHTPWNAVPPLVVSEPLYLPDVLFVPFSSTLSFDQFPAGTTISSCNDLQHVFVNMEHAFVGDLDIWIECPNGTTVSLSQSGAGFASLGVPYPGDSPNPGVGWDYYWSPTATNGTWLQNAPNTPPSTAQTLPSGTYQSNGNLCSLVGCPLNGDWTIYVEDNFSSSNGYLFSWGLGLDPSLFSSLPTFTPSTVSTYWNGPFVPAGQQGAVFTASNPTLGTFDYSYHVVTNYGCNFDSTIAITYHDPAVITAGPNKNYTCLPIILEAGILTSSPYTYQWSWSPTTALSNPNIANPTVNDLVQTTTYTVTVVPTGFPECAQTDNMTVNVVPSMVTSLETSFNGCQGETITLPAPTITGGVQPFTYEWILPNGQSILQPTIDVIAQGVEIYCAVVNDGCLEPDTLCTMVTTYPTIPASFSVDTISGCAPAQILFQSTYTQVQNVSQMRWYFDDDQEAVVLSSANHSYQQEGVYYPWLEITDVNGCVYRDTVENPLLIWPSPNSDFITNPEMAFLPNTAVQFVNNSTGALSYLWDFDQFGQSSVFDTTLVFPQTAGHFPVTLHTYNQYGCSDSLTRLIEVRDQLNIFIPNTFSPNGDGINDVWSVEGAGFRDFGYILRVFNRWGEPIFESTDPEQSWVGDTNLGEYYFVQDGVYPFRLEVIDTVTDVKHVYTGSVLVIR